MKKEEARRKGFAARKALHPEERSRYESIIFEKVMAEVSDAATVGCYVSFGDEADTHRIILELLKRNKRVAVPKTLKSGLEFHVISSMEELKPGVWGIQEPENDDIIPPREIDVMLVPLSAFDDQMHRTGYGKGYYDRILAECRRKTGIAYSCQKTDEIETDPWDVDLDCVITECSG